jgi:hypothetical protein
MMKKALILLPILALMALAPAMALPTNTSLGPPTPPVTLNFTVYGCQYQWRAFSAAPSGPFGEWTYYQYYGQYSDGPFVLKGNTLTTTLTFAPTVTDQIPTVANLVYKFNSELNIWILPPTTLSYLYSLYGPYRVTDIFTGYMAFSGAPSATGTYKEDVMYQWEYIFGVPQSGSKATALLLADPTAVWDSSVGAWQVGLSVYVDNVANTAVVTNNGATSPTTPSLITGVPFPSVYVPIEPYGPENYDPLHL